MALTPIVKVVDLYVFFFYLNLIKEDNSFVVIFLVIDIVMIC